MSKPVIAAAYVIDATGVGVRWDQPVGDSALTAGRYSLNGLSISTISRLGSDGSAVRLEVEAIAPGAAPSLSVSGVVSVGGETCDPATVAVEPAPGPLAWRETFNERGSGDSWGLVTDEGGVWFAYLGKVNATHAAGGVASVSGVICRGPSRDFVESGYSVALCIGDVRLEIGDATGYTVPPGETDARSRSGWLRLRRGNPMSEDVTTLREGPLVQSSAWAHLKLAIADDGTISVYENAGAALPNPAAGAITVSNPWSAVATGRALDARAADAAYYFRVQRDGADAYATSGRFYSSAGQLFHAATELPVLDDAGQAITFAPGAAVTIGTDGTITADGSAVARIDTYAESGSAWVVTGQPLTIGETWTRSPVAAHPAGEAGNLSTPTWTAITGMAPVASDPLVDGAPVGVRYSLGRDADGQMITGRRAWASYCVVTP
jgi:hypothetical protein